VSETHWQYWFIPPASAWAWALAWCLILTGGIGYLTSMSMSMGKIRNKWFNLSIDPSG
jgi:hypothetical protein